MKRKSRFGKTGKVVRSLSKGLGKSRLAKAAVTPIKIKRGVW